MGTETNNLQQLHIMFFPFMAAGHMLPIVDMARFFAARGVKTTIVTTPLNAPLISTRRSIKNGTTLLINFPAEEAGLPQGFENVDQVNSEETCAKFTAATSMFQQPLEQILEEYRPHALVADMFFPWATDLAAKFGIPRLVFTGSCIFSLCAGESLFKYMPHKKVSSDTEPFLLPGLPDQVKLTRSQLFDHIRLEIENEFTRLLGRAFESFERSYGIIFNSFYELEPAYVDEYKKGKKGWLVGPVSLCNSRDAEDEVQREASHDCLKWLVSKTKPNSVVYVCFGSLSRFTASQLLEIATGLEASGQEFIWVVRKVKDEGEKENWLPEGFEERIKGKGLIIRGWAPQLLILDHNAVGGFVTHCGWNSILEGVSAGLPMVTWPSSAEQFYNEKLVTDVLKIGVGVGAQQWIMFAENNCNTVKRDAIEKAVKQIMLGEEAEEMRSRARALGETARRAVDEGGSSCNDMNALIEELKLYRAA